MNLQTPYRELDAASRIARPSATERDPAGRVVLAIVLAAVGLLIVGAIAALAGKSPDLQAIEQTLSGP